MSNFSSLSFLWKLRILQANWLKNTYFIFIFKYAARIKKIHFLNECIIFIFEQHILGNDEKFPSDFFVILFTFQFLCNSFFFRSFKMSPAFRYITNFLLLTALEFLWYDFHTLVDSCSVETIRSDCWKTKRNSHNFLFLPRRNTNYKIKCNISVF